MSITKSIFFATLLCSSLCTSVSLAQVEQHVKSSGKTNLISEHKKVCDAEQIYEDSTGSSVKNHKTENRSGKQAADSKPADSDDDRRLGVGQEDVA